MRYIYKTLRKTLIEDPDINSLIKNRFYPQRSNIVNTTFPCVTFNFAGGTPDQDYYPIDRILVEMNFCSKDNYDDCFILYEKIRFLINTNKFTSSDGEIFSIYEDTLPINDTIFINNEPVYILSNTWLVKKIG